MPGFRQPKTEDFAEAGRLLAKVGVTPQTPVELRMPVRNGQFPAQAAQIATKQLEPFGIKVKMDMKDFAAVGPDLRSGNWDINPDFDG